MSITTAKEKFLSFPDNIKGAIILMFAAVCFALMTLLIKLSGERLHVTQILLVRQLVMTIVVVPAILNNFPSSLKSNNISLQFIRLFFALIAMLLGFTAVINLPLADVTAIAFAKSFFVTIFAVLILKEVVGLRRWGAVAVGFLGVAFMLQPGTTGFSIYGIYALISAGCAGIVMVIIRLMSRTDSPITILSYQAIGIGVIMAIPGYIYWQWPTMEEWFLLIGVGLVSYVGQLANIYAFKWGEASMLASLDYVRLIYATILGYLVFGDLPDFYTWIGAGVIIAAAIYTIRREATRKQALNRSAEGRGYNT